MVRNEMNSSSFQVYAGIASIRDTSTEKKEITVKFKFYKFNQKEISKILEIYNFYVSH